MLAVHLYERYMASNSAGRFIIDFHKKAGEAIQRHTVCFRRKIHCFKENKLRSVTYHFVRFTENSHYIVYNPPCYLFLIRLINSSPGFGLLKKPVKSDVVVMNSASLHPASAYTYAELQ